MASKSNPDSRGGHCVFWATGVSDARFLASRFYCRQKGVVDLRKLALLTLGYAANDNPGNIGGSFDLMTLDRTDRNFKFEHFESLDNIFAAFDKDLTGVFERLTIT